jgi:hypothetical protein
MMSTKIWAGTCCVNEVVLPEEKRPICIAASLITFSGRNLAKVGVEGSNPFARSKIS